jgi:ubiquinol-cytochrome c reductase cytochrome b subunit
VELISCLIEFGGNLTPRERQRVTRTTRLALEIPIPAPLTVIWNFGSILGLCAAAQITTGVLLAIQYYPSRETAFKRLAELVRDVQRGWWLRCVHANGASVFFIFCYIHIARGLYYGRYIARGLWWSGVVLVVTLIAIGFLGYVLPWGQISLWGATVITNLIRAVPYWGEGLVLWVWGGFSVNERTLVRFFALHFLLPIGLGGLIAIHLSLLHRVGSNNFTGVNSRLDKIPFHPYYRRKDVVGWLLAFRGLGLIVLEGPWVLGDRENFLQADRLVTPVHIKPEWYFLFAYGVLRRVPNKLGGVVALVIAVAVLAVLPLRTTRVANSSNRVKCKIVFWWWLRAFSLITWVGGKPVEEPYIIVSQVGRVIYFALILGWVV